jgi:exodeoxyribonuclease-3
VLCLQEIKTEEKHFPHEAFEALGYTHRAVHGQKGYHGVATVSRIPIRELTRNDWQANGEARHVGVELLGPGQGMVLENVYIPAGGDIPDREANPKFGQKLDFLERMTQWSAALDRPTLLVGDFNIAPLECDVYDHKALLKVVSHTPLEVETLVRLADAHGWVDLGRKHIPAPERNWTWWSYRTLLAGKGSRAAARPYVGFARARRAVGRASLGRGNPPLGSAERPHSADHGIRSVTSPAPVVLAALHRRLMRCATAGRLRWTAPLPCFQRRPASLRVRRRGRC